MSPYEVTPREHLAFDLSLHHRLAPAPERSFCWSPHSVASALGLAAAAAAGHTRRELVGVLGTEPERLAAFLTEAGRLEPAAADEPVLAVANSLWAQQELPLNPEFLEGLRDWPGSAVRHAPFRTAPEQARQLINDDVSETTRGLVPEHERRS